jgi:hypothetical protein
MLSADPPTMVLGLPDAPGPATAVTTGLETLLFGLSLAVALPPAALLPPGTALRTVLPAPEPLLGTTELSALVGRSALETGLGRFALREVDRRLDGLEAALSLFRLTREPATLVCLGIVGPERAAGRPGAATVASLWALAREALPRHAVVSEDEGGVGPAALLVRYPGATIQRAWLIGDRLATVSVTSMDGDESWTKAAARSIAAALDRRLQRDGGPACRPSSASAGPASPRSAAASMPRARDTRFGCGPVPTRPGHRQSPA